MSYDDENDDTNECNEESFKSTKLRRKMRFDLEGSLFLAGFLIEF